MAETPPPDRTTLSASAASGADVGVTEARGAVRTGRNIWILVISTVLAAVVLFGYWLLHAPGFSTADHPHVQNVSTFNTPAGSARQAPPGEPSTETNSQ